MCRTESSSGMEHPVEYGVTGMPMKAVEEESNQQTVGEFTVRMLQMFMQYNAWRLDK